MKIDELYPANSILLNFNAKNKLSAIEALTKNFARVYHGVDERELLQSLMKREELGSTGIDHGVAIPHANINHIDKPKGLLAISQRGVDFNSIDGELTHFLILIVYPQNFFGRQTQVLSKIARLFRDKTLRESILKAHSPEKVLEILKAKEPG